MRRGNGEGSVFKLGGKRRKPWAVRVTIGFTPEGKQLYKYLSYHTSKSEAKKALAEYTVNPYNLEQSNVTLYRAYEKFIATNPVSENTMNNYKSAFRKCQPLYDMPIKLIKPGHIEEIMQEYTPAAQKALKNLLNKLFRYAMKHEMLDKNIIELVDTDPVESQPKIPFNKKQVGAIMNYDNHHLAHTIKIMLYTGMRISELLELETKNIYLEEDYMIGGLKTPTGKNRIIPIHKEIKSLIEAAYNPKNKYLIVDERGKPVSYRYFLMDFWTTIKTEIGFTQTPHSTRHTFITHALRCGADRDMIQKIVGHKGDVTDRYNHAQLEQLKLEINKLSYN